ncbi:MAG: replicative helicase [Ramlibacter sp.]|jgi:replicative DNA helicase|nr:replicative helicase [Ramlibacter sp.]
MSARTPISEDEAFRGAVLNGSLRNDQAGQLCMPPMSIEAESSVLGGLLQDNALWDIVGDLVTKGDFYRHEHKVIFEAIDELIKSMRPADVVTVYEHLQRSHKGEEIGGLGYLNSLAQYVPSAANTRRYAELVRERSILRRLLAVSREIATAALNPEGKSVNAILEAAVQRVMAIDAGANDEDWQPGGTGIADVIDRMQAEANGKIKPQIISTGLKDLDERLDGGMRPGEVIVIGARPSMGKSALGLTIGVTTAGAGEPTGYWSGEMPRPQLWNRALSMLSQVHLSRIKRANRLLDADWPSITHGAETIRCLPLYVNDKPAMTIAKMRATARGLKRKRGLRVLVVDYLGLMDGTDPKQPRTYQLEEITKGMKQLAKELGLAVILLVQLSRKVEERVDQMPILSDLRDSGAIEQDADIVIFVHRPWKAKPDLGDEWKYYARLSVAKLRDGEPGYVDLMYVGENTRFGDWPAGMRVPSRAQAARLMNPASQL